MQQEANKDAASTFITGFLWAMDAAGYISSEKRKEMSDALSALRFPDRSVEYYKTVATQEIAARQQDGGGE